MPFEQDIPRRRYQQSIPLDSLSAHASVFERHHLSHSISVRLHIPTLHQSYSQQIVMYSHVHWMESWLWRALDRLAERQMPAYQRSKRVVIKFAYEGDFLINLLDCGHREGKLPYQRDHRLAEYGRCVVV